MCVCVSCTRPSTQVIPAWPLSPPAPLLPCRRPSTCVSPSHAASRLQGAPQPSPVLSVSPLAPPHHGPTASPPAQTHSGTPGQAQPAQGHVSSAPLHNAGSQVKLFRAPAHRAAMGGVGMGCGGHCKVWGPYCFTWAGGRALEWGVGGSLPLAARETCSCFQLCVSHVWALSPVAPQT